jgi:nucleoside-diphosphate-sugar epimerase
MTTLITGGTGLIGTTLAEQLLTGGERVVLFDVALPEARVAALRRHGERLKLVRGDVQALGEMISVIRAEQVEAIVHLAFVLGGVGNAEPERASRVNVLGTVNALEAARLTGVPRVILASSIAVYGSDDQYSAAELPLGEDAARHVCRTLLIYGGGKLYTEHLAHVYARTYGLVTGGLRPSVVYGPGRDSGGSAFLNEVIEKPALGEPVAVGFGDAGISFVHVEDVAGQFAAPEIQKLAAELFGSWKSPGSYTRVTNMYRKIAPAERKIETPDKESAFFGAGLRIPMRDDAPEYPALFLGNYMTGSSGMVVR